LSFGDLGLRARQGRLGVLDRSIVLELRQRLIRCFRVDLVRLSELELALRALYCRLGDAQCRRVWTSRQRIEIGLSLGQRNLSAGDIALGKSDGVLVWPGQGQVESMLCERESRFAVIGD